MAKLVIIFLSCSLVGFLITVAIYLGVFEKVDVQVDDFGPNYLVYKLHTGPYHKIGATIIEVEDWAKRQNVDCPKTFGEYLDDPNEVDSDNLRSHGGCVLSAPPENGIPENFELKSMSRARAVIVNFEGSPAIGPYKVYPEAMKWFERSGQKWTGRSLEFYKVKDNSMTTQYVFPFVEGTY